MVNRYVSLYTHESPHWENITFAVTELGFTELTAETASEYFDVNGVQKRYSREVVESSTRVNYGQVGDEHSLKCGRKFTYYTSEIESRRSVCNGRCS